MVDGATVWGEVGGCPGASRKVSSPTPDPFSWPRTLLQSWAEAAEFLLSAFSKLKHVVIGGSPP